MHKKKIFLEFLRIISIILVLFNHTGRQGFFLYMGYQGTSYYWIYMFISLACKVAVPTFWMISGALLIDKEESFSTIFKKRFLRMLLVLIVFSVFQYFYNCTLYDYKPSILTFFKIFYTSEHASAYWFLYNYLSMLILLPLIRKAVKSLSNKELIYGFFISLLFRGIIPIVQYVIDKDLVITNNLYEFMFPLNLTYFVGGYYFEKRVDKLSLKRSIIWFFVGIFGILVSCLMTHYQYLVTGVIDEEISQTFYNSLIVLPTFSMFYITKYIFTKIKVYNVFEKLILDFGGAAFGVMLVENILRATFIPLYYRFFSYSHPLGACIIWILCSWFCGSLIVILIKKIPGVKKFI